MYPDDIYPGGTRYRTVSLTDERFEELVNLLNAERNKTHDLRCVLNTFWCFKDEKNFLLALKVSKILVQADQKISAIKVVRELFEESIGIKEAKLFVEWAANR